jgi:nitroreductase
MRAPEGAAAAIVADLFSLLAAERHPYVDPLPLISEAPTPHVSHKQYSALSYYVCASLASDLLHSAPVESADDAAVGYPQAVQAKPFLRSETMMTVSEAIATLRAVRRFAETPLPDDEVRAILNAGRRAQSSKNEQPRHFVAVRVKQTLKQLSECGDFAGHLAGAALGVALVSPANSGDSFAWDMFDLGQSTALMQLEAWDLSIGSCIATMYQQDEAKAILGVPTEMRLELAISFGYPADRQVFTRPPRTGGRRPLDEVVHWEHW